MIPISFRKTLLGLTLLLPGLSVMPAYGQQVETGELIVGFTSKFTLDWNDSGSGGNSDGSFWQPVAPAGFFLVGDYAQSGYDDPNGKAVVMVLKAKQSGALAAPVDFKLVWKDSGSGADRDGSMWNMVCPGNYVALGSVSQAGYGKPDANAYRCVQAALSPAGAAGSDIWNDKGTGAKSDFSAWAIQASTARPGYANLSSGSFVAQSSHGKPTSANTLLIPVASPQKAQEPRKPELNGFGKPSPYAEDSVKVTTLLPWFAVADPGLTAVQKLAQSPVYALVREDRYKLIMHVDNQNGSAAQKPEVNYTEGVSQTDEQNFSKTTGISVTVGYTPPGETGGVHASVTLSRETTTGWAKSTTTESSTTQKLPINVPVGTAGAVYQVVSEFTLVRNGGNGQTVGSTLSGGAANSIYFASFGG